MAGHRVFLGNMWYFQRAIEVMRTGDFRSSFYISKKLESPVDLVRHIDQLYFLGLPALLIYDHTLVDWITAAVFLHDTTPMRVVEPRGSPVSGDIEKIPELLKRLAKKGVLAEAEIPKTDQSVATARDLRDREMIKGFLMMMPEFDMPDSTPDEEKAVDGLLEHVRGEFLDEVTDYMVMLTTTLPREELTSLARPSSPELKSKLPEQEGDLFDFFVEQFLRATGDYLDKINRIAEFSRKEKLDALVFNEFMPFLVYKLFKARHQEGLLEAFSNVTLVLPAKKMSFEELLDWRTKLSGVSSTLNHYRDFYAREDIGGLMGAYKQFRNERNKFYWDVANDRGSFHLITSSVRLTRDASGVASFLVPDINFSQTFDYFSDINPRFQAKFRDLVQDMTIHLADAVELRRPTYWRDTLGSLGQLLGVFSSSWLVSHGRGEILDERPPLGDIVKEIRRALSPLHPRLENFLHGILDEVQANRNFLQHPESYPDKDFQEHDILGYVCDTIDAMKFISAVDPAKKPFQ